MGHGLQFDVGHMLCGRRLVSYRKMFIVFVAPVSDHKMTDPTLRMWIDLYASICSACVTKSLGVVTNNGYCHTTSMETLSFLALT